VLDDGTGERVAVAGRLTLLQKTHGDCFCAAVGEAVAPAMAADEGLDGDDDGLSLVVPKKHQE
jgi:hypothetical protein